MPDSYEEHVKLMFDLQALAFGVDITRVFAFKMSRDVSGRVFPSTGVSTGFHNASHHNSREDRIRDFAKINRYHVSLLPYFIERLKRMPEGDGTVLDNTLVIYGSPMGDPNVHNHKRCPLLFAGHAGGALKGGLHIKAADGTPMANSFLDALHKIGHGRHAVLRRQLRRARPERRAGHHGGGPVGDSGHATTTHWRTLRRRARRPVLLGGHDRRPWSTVPDAAMSGRRRRGARAAQGRRRRERGAGRRRDRPALGRPPGP